LLLREDFKTTPEYRTVYRKSSFDNWDVPIKTLGAWGILLPEVVTAFNELKQVRNRAIHFNPITEQNDRSLALMAIELLDTIISKQFGAFGLQTWFIPDIPGASYIKKDAEQDPFVRKVIIPN
jgi:hypothetical protein